LPGSRLGKVANGLVLTRGLKPKHNPKTQVAENTLTFTTSEW
jgi:hypothetical protein